MPPILHRPGRMKTGHQENPRPPHPWGAGSGEGWDTCATRGRSGTLPCGLPPGWPRPRILPRPGRMKTGHQEKPRPPHPWGAGSGEGWDTCATRGRSGTLPCGLRRTAPSPALLHPGLMGAWDLLLTGLVILFGLCGVLVPGVPGSWLVWAGVAWWALKDPRPVAWWVLVGATVLLFLSQVVRWALPPRRLRVHGTDAHM